jgi:hypothetical protein
MHKFHNNIISTMNIYQNVTNFSNRSANQDICSFIEPEVHCHIHNILPLVCYLSRRIMSLYYYTINFIIIFPSAPYFLNNIFP